MKYLSKQDKLKSRVLMAKAQIPVAQVGRLYAQKFPDTNLSDLRMVLNLRGTDELITERLEFLAATFTPPRGVY